jgi:hypothetical protein
MKKIYLLFFASVLALNTKAQLSLTQAANAPVSGQIEHERKYDSTTAIPKATGTNKSWNFTSFNSNSTTNNYTYVPSSSTPSASAFPGSTLATTDGAGYYSYYINNAASLDWKGTLDIPSADKAVFTNPLTWMVWPFTYGTTNTDNFSGTETYSTVNVPISGTLTVSGTGTGTVTMPQGIAYTNCLQVTRTYTYVLGSPMDFTLTIKTYEYWTSSYRNPIVNVTYTKVDDGSTITNIYNISTNTLADVGIKEQGPEIGRFVVYPNPVKDKLNVLLTDGSTVQEIQLFDINGKLVAKEANSNSLNTAGLNKGVYVLKVKAKDAFSQKQIIISE